jgi:uncharacterized protein YjhX (UPF0386 family)
MALKNVINSASSIYMIGKMAWNVYKTIARQNPSLTTSKSSWRPPQWADYGSNEDQMIYLAPNISEVEKKVGEIGETYEVTVGYYFDAFTKENHTGSVRVTEHPVQGGANISDHAYNLADKLTLEILVSDSVESIVAGQFAGGKTKSISAYEVIRKLKEKRALVSVRTRLHYYTNMIIENMTTSDDYKSANSLRCTVILRQVMMAVVATEYVTLKKKQAVNSENTGPKIAQAPKDPILVRITRHAAGN